MSNQFLFKPCTLEEASKISPWPARLSGKEAWVKKERKIEDVLAEYDRYWYGKLIKDWSSFSATLGKKPQLHDVLRFYKNLDRKINQEVGRNKKIYRSTVERFLISASDQLYEGNLDIATAIFDWFIDNEIQHVVEQTKSRTIVELGFGTGKHMFRLLSILNLAQAIGGEICGNAVKLGNQIAKESGVNARFDDFNFYDSASYRKLIGNQKNYIVYTSHAIEQIPVLGDVLIESLRALPHPPQAVVHFEPVIFPKEKGFNELCSKYAAMNKYNMDLWSVLQKFERAGKIEILKVAKRIFGNTAFNPTTVIAWKFKK